MSDKTPFQIQQAGTNETLSATVIERMEPEEICCHICGIPESM